MAKNRKPATTESSAAATGLADRIRERAYEIYLRNGSQKGRDVENWLQAEAEILRELETGRPTTVTAVA